MFGIFRKFRNWFYSGPALFNYPGRRMRGYRSPNLMLGQWLHAITVKHFTPAGRYQALISVGILTLSG